jgi:hypothetical protein
MSEQTPDETRTTGPDPDADPDNLNPREGGQAAGGLDEGVDPDSDPDMLNPRTGDQATSGDEL